MSRGYVLLYGNYIWLELCTTWCCTWDAMTAYKGCGLCAGLGSRKTGYAKPLLWEWYLRHALKSPSKAEYIYRFWASTVEVLDGTKRSPEFRSRSSGLLPWREIIGSGNIRMECFPCLWLLEARGKSRWEPSELSPPPAEL